MWIRLMWIGVVTLFPEMFDAVTRFGISGRAVQTSQVQVQLWNPRDFTEDRHQTVDDRPFGGGPGMLMKVAPLTRAIAAARAGRTPYVLCLSPQGKPLQHRDVVRLARLPELVLVAGRYEGIDERVLQAEVDEEVSIGDFVVSGGELPAMLLIDAVVRLQPGALGDDESAVGESFVDGLLDFPQYTRPREIDGRVVPEVLLSGNHEQIRQWRLQQSLGRTWLRRPDLLADRVMTDEEQRLLAVFKLDLAQQQSNEEDGDGERSHS